MVTEEIYGYNNVCAHVPKMPLYDHDHHYLREEFVEQRDDIRVLAGEVENEMSKLVQN